MGSPLENHAEVKPTIMANEREALKRLNRLFDILNQRFRSGVRALSELHATIPDLWRVVRSTH